VIHKMDLGGFELECDECGHFETFEVDGDFQLMIHEAKEGGWLIKPDGHGDWKHVCPECKRGGA